MRSKYGKNLAPGHQIWYTVENTARGMNACIWISAARWSYWGTI